MVLTVNGQEKSQNDELCSSTSASTSTKQWTTCKCGQNSNKKGTFPGSSLQAINPVFSVMLCMCACLAWCSWKIHMVCTYLVDC